MSIFELIPKGWSTQIAGVAPYNTSEITFLVTEVGIQKLTSLYHYIPNCIGMPYCQIFVKILDQLFYNFLKLNS